MTTMQFLSFLIVPIGAVAMGLAALFYARTITRNDRHR
jgi:hypothetical protein